MTERFTEPTVYLTGYTATNMAGILQYLEDSGNQDFIETMRAAEADGVKSAEMLCSMYAKLCYKALAIGQNVNITRVRDIPDNLKGCFKAGHGSIFEHVGMSFIIRNCSRVFTHELVRHRIGTAFSQTSGRYVRLNIGGTRIVWDPILDGCQELSEALLEYMEAIVYLMECRKGLRKIPDLADDTYSIPEDCFAVDNTVFPPRIILAQPEVMWVPDNSFDFATKKKITSAIRRHAPNGQTNEMGFSCNIRSLRHTILMRTGRHSEWEIRKVFEQIYRLAKHQFPLLFFDAKEEIVEGITEVTGMKMQPYEKTISDYSDQELVAELKERDATFADVVPAEPQTESEVTKDESDAAVQD